MTRTRSRSARALSGALSLTLALTGLTLMAASPAAAAPAVVYDSIPETQPASYPSLGYQAQSTWEFGDHVRLGAGNRALSEITIGMNSWACESGTWNVACATTTPGSGYVHPVTLTVYDVAFSGGTPVPGAVIASVTNDVSVPFRPSPSPDECGGPTTTTWWDAERASCQNGYAFDVTFDLSSEGAIAGNDVIVTVAYSTQSYGAAPLGVDGPYNALNVSLNSISAPSVGTDVSGSVMMRDTTYSGSTRGLKASGLITGYNGLVMEIVADSVPVADPLTDVTVYDRDVKPNETAETYTSWHEGKASATPSNASVLADGLHLGDGAASTVIKGTDLSSPEAAAANAVTRAELRALVSSASVVVESGTVTYQVPVFFGNPAAPSFTTLRSTSLAAGAQSFSQSDTWATTRAFGTYTAQEEAPLGELIDAIFDAAAAAGGGVVVGGYGVQADSPAVVSQLVWDDTRYTFVQPVIEACVPTSGDAITNLDLASWTFTETRSQGINEFVEGGLRVETFDNEDGSGPGSPDQRKAAGYHPIDIALSEVGTPALEIAPGFTGVRPSLQLGFDADGDGTRDAYLVGEPWAYGGGDWSPTVNGEWADAKYWVTGSNGFGVAPGAGYPALGTLDEYLLANPEARITNYGYSLGSGVVGEAVITSITVGCVSYGFTFELETLAPPTVQRLAGADRYETAIEISQYGFADGEPTTVYIATGEGYADALSAVPAAGADSAPLLLTPTNSLPANVRTELIRLDPSEIVVVGGTGVVSPAVVAALEALPFDPTVRRVAGADRYATSQAIARDAFPTATTAYVATGLGFADALAAGPAASAAGGPVVLVPGGNATVDAATLDLLDELGVSQVVIAGGTGVVSAGIATQLDVPYLVTRNAGADRYATAVAINEYAFTVETRAFLATGEGFADALTGAAMAAAFGNPLYTSPTACLPAATLGSIVQLGTTTIVLLGGTGVLSLAVENLDLCAGGTL